MGAFCLFRQVLWLMVSEFCIYKGWYGIFFLFPAQSPLPASHCNERLLSYPKLQTSSQTRTAVFCWPIVPRNPLGNLPGSRDWAKKKITIIIKEKIVSFFWPRLLFHLESNDRRTNQSKLDFQRSLWLTNRWPRSFPSGNYLFNWC